MGHEPGEVRGVHEGLGEHGPLLGQHEHLHAHCLGHDEDVTEDDAGVEEGVAVDRLEGQGRGDRGGLTAFEEGVVFPHGEELCRLEASDYELASSSREAR